jgi:hypothetical protein
VTNRWKRIGFVYGIFVGFVVFATYVLKAAFPLFEYRSSVIIILTLLLTTFVTRPHANKRWPDPKHGWAE